MKDIEGRLRSYKETPWCNSPKAYQNIVLAKGYLHLGFTVLNFLKPLI